jgi:Flp pilus assembly protein CpaB
VTAQRGLIALAVAAGVIAAALYLLGTQRVSVVVAAADLPAGRAIAGADLETRDLPPDALPASALRDLGAAVGRSPRGPIWKGQLLVADALASAPAAFASGVTIPTGYHAIAIPVDAAHALGGALVPGSRVDVIAVPVAGRAPAARATELLARAALVLDVRGEQGAAFDRIPAARQQGTAARDRLGSVVIAVGPTAELALADRIPTSTFVLVLAPEVP